MTRRKSTPDDQTRAGFRWICQTDLYALARRVLYKDAQTPMTLDFHQRLCQWRQTSPWQRNLYLLSRDHLKSSLLTIAGNVQRLLRDPTTRILIASNKAESAQGQLAEIKGHLSNPILLWLFPDVLWSDPSKDADKWTESAITVKRKRKVREASIETIGVEGEVTSKHYDHGSFDDLVGLENSQTRDQLEKTIRWYQTAQSLFEPQATQEIVGTPWEFGDLYDWLIQQKYKREMKLGVYRQPCFKVTHPGVLRVNERGGVEDDEWDLDSQGRLQPAYPEKHSLQSLTERKGILGPRIWAAQWLLRPTDDESAIFPRGKAVIRPRAKLPPVDELWCVMAVDPAISIKEWADYSAIATLGFDSYGIAYVLDLRRGRWTETEMVDQVYAAYRQTPGVRVIGFEVVGFQKLYMREFQRAGETRGYLPIVKLERDNKVAKSVRIRSLEPFWSSQSLVFADDLPTLEDFLEEAERFRPYKEALHDDMLDALADCLQLRVRPEPPDPDEGLDDDDRERRQVEREYPHLDRSSLRQTIAIRRTRVRMEAEREQEALGAVEASEFYS